MSYLTLSSAEMMVWALLILVTVCLNLFHGTHLVSSFLDPHVTLNMSCCREATDCLLSWGLLVSVWTQRVVELPKAWRETVRQERLVASANIQHAGRWGREGKSFPVIPQPELYILWRGETFSGCICIWVGCVWRGFQGRALVFAGHLSTKRGHERASGDITEERARAEGRVSMGRFRHGAVKFHSTSIIPLTPRRVRSVVDRRGRVGQTHWAASLPGVSYTTGRGSCDAEFCFLSRRVVRRPRWFWQGRLPQ